MSRIAAHLDALQKRGEKAFIPFLTIGDPSPAVFLEMVNRIEPCADIIELGIPFSDPMADGPVIQRANGRALKEGVTLGSSFDLIRKIRAFTKKPIVLLTYANILGVDELLSQTLKKFADCGVDGIIAADVPLEESEELVREAEKVGVDIIFLATPTTSSERLKKIVAVGRGFLYLVAVKGVTGARDTIMDETASTIKRITTTLAEQQTEKKLPVLVGFGISTPSHVREVIRLGADGAIVGSAIIKIIEQHNGSSATLFDKVMQLVKQLKAATKFSAPKASNRM